MSLGRWVKHLFQSDAPGGKSSPERVVTKSASASLSSNGNAEDANLQAIDWDAAYISWLLNDELAAIGGASNPQISKQYQPIYLGQLQALTQTSSGQELLPRVPQIVPQLFRSLRNENASDRELAGMIAKDVTLVAELLQEANSAYYGLKDKVSSIENAVRLIGENGLRMMLAKVAFRPVIRDQFGTQTKHLSPYIWQQSELCGLVAQKLAEREKHDPFMAFLAGLVSNVGMIVALRIADRMSTQFFLQGESAFQMQVLKQARQISAHVAQQWEFPSGVVLALQEQIGISENSLALSMANIVRHANHISQICVLRSRGVRQADEANLKRVCDTRMCKDVELFYREFQKIQAGK